MSELEDSIVVGIAPQFTAHVLDDRQVLLLSEQRSFRLVGKLYVALLPHLDGSRPIRDVVAAFGGRVAPGKIGAVLADMHRKGYVAKFPPGAPHGRLALWTESDIPAIDAESAMAAYRVRVRSLAGPDAEPDADEMLLRTALTGMGLCEAKVDEVPSLTLVVVRDYLDRRLADFNREMRAKGYAWMPVKLGGSVPMAGPLLGPRSSCCWACLANQLLENRPGDRAVPNEVMCARPARAGTASSRATFAGLVAWEIARTAADGQSESFSSHVCTFSFRQREWRSHFIRQSPRCTVCGEGRDRAKQASGSAGLHLQSQPILPSDDGGWRTQPTERVLAKLEKYVSPITGVIAEVEDCSPAAGLHVFRARQANPIAVTPRQNRLLGKPGAAAGKGIGAAQARASCLAEAMERYLCGYTGTETGRRATWSEIAHAAPHPAVLLNYSDHQIEGRLDWNAVHDGFNWIGERFDDARSIEWTPAWSLARNQARWLPTRYCYFGYSDPMAAKDDENLFCIADSNGCASGSTLEEAILQGFLELVERDACALWWYNRVKRPAFDLKGTDDPFIRRVEAFCESKGRGLHVLDLTNDIGIPTAIALSFDERRGNAIFMGLGSHLDCKVAVNRALAELNQMMMLEAEFSDLGKREEDGKGDTGVMGNWLKTNTLYTEPYCVPDGKVSMGKYASPRFADLKEAVERCVRITSDMDLDFIVLDHSRPEIDFSAARVVVPGLRHFWARFRTGRLYTAPVRLGWLEREKTESDLNPIPFFL